ncbi:MAG TPA: hypothetical protein VF396_05955, partial [Bradyrhizobium sp.]
MASQICIKDTGPEATVPALFASVPRGRRVEKSSPMPPALLHRDRSFLQGLKNAGDRVFDRPHHEAIEKCDVSRRSGAGLNAAAGQKLEVLQDAEIPGFPTGRIVRLDSRERAGNPTPAIRDRALVRVPILGLP